MTRSSAGLREGSSSKRCLPDVNPRCVAAMRRSRKCARLLIDLVGSTRRSAPMVADRRRWPRHDARPNPACRRSAVVWWWLAAARWWLAALYQALWSRTYAAGHRHTGAGLFHALSGASRPPLCVICVCVSCLDIPLRRPILRATETTLQLCTTDTQTDPSVPLSTTCGPAQRQAGIHS